MPKQTSSTPRTTPKVDGPSGGTPTGTATYGKRFQSRFAADYFREASNGLCVSSIGVGTYLGNNADDDDRAYTAVVRRAIESGINLIDTAINYRSQRSEQAIGEAIQDVLSAGVVSRDELVICSKGGYIPLDRTPPATREEYQRYVRREFIDSEILRADEISGGGHSLAPRFLRYCLAKSRQNLGLRSIDIYYLHNPGQQLATLAPDEVRPRLKAAFAFLEEAASRGEIGAYGCATWDELRVPPDTRGHLALEELVAIARGLAGEAHHFRFLQLPINLAMLEAVRAPTQMLAGKPVSVVEAAAELELSVVSSASLMQGRLASGLSEAVRAHFPELETDAQRALAFVRTIPGVTTALVGMKQLAHLDENLDAARAPSGTE